VKRSVEMAEAWKIRIFVVLLIASVIAGVDGWLKLLVPTPPWAFHHRSQIWLVGSCVLFILVSALAFIPSRAVMVGSGIFCGGVLGNLLSASADHLYVPNPFVVGSNAGVAFNFADASLLSGNFLLVGSLCVMVLKHREELRDRSAVRRAILVRLKNR
jgi:hypothetical protein